LQAKQEKENLEFQNQIKDKIPKKANVTPEMLSMEIQINNLVKTQKYNEAGHLQKKLDKMRLKCDENLSYQMEESFRNQFDVIEKKHNLELTKFQAKQQQQEQELFKFREQDFETLNRKFKVL